MSIWKKDSLFAGLYDGPRSRLHDGNFHLAAKYSEVQGVQFYGHLASRQEDYTLAEVRAIYGAIGRVLDKVDAEPKPTAGDGAA